MARVVTERIVSDLSGKEIADGRAWVMTLTPPDGRRNPVRLDISEDEARQWTSMGTEAKRRGRRPGSASASGTKAAPANGRRRRAKAAAPAKGRRRGTAATPANGRRKRRSKA